MSSKYKLLGNRGESSLSSILTIFIFIVVVAIALWGAVNAVKFAPRLYEIISSPFGGKKSALTITAPVEAVANEEAFSIVWEHTSDATGQYAFRYDCTDGMGFEAPVAEGGVYGDITCNIPYGVPSTERSIRLIPKNTNTASTSVPFTLTFTDGEGAVITETQGNVVVLTGEGTTGTPVVTPAKPSTTDTPKKPTTTAPAGGTTQTTTPKPAASGPADLAITFLSMEVANAYNGGYAPYGEYNEGDVVNIRFDVKNRGHRATGPWTFTAHLPAGNGYYYTSPVQRSLNPQDGAVYTLTFTMPSSGTLTIEVDPSDAVTESAEYNNTLVQTLQAYGYQDYGTYPMYQDGYTGYQDTYYTYQDPYNYQTDYGYQDPYVYQEQWQQVGW
ncbi:MAG: hypothetical protein KBE09_01845 [Candidatus Pacebacteria bacterium]|nr:hypothetical protein [Candidatus Paceibacterota bacterium]